jgi:hypothetical protein
MPGHKEGDAAEVTLFIESANHKTLKLYYKGDRKDLGDPLNRSVTRFIDELDAAAAAPHQIHPRARTLVSGR